MVLKSMRFYVYVYIFSAGYFMKIYQATVNWKTPKSLTMVNFQFIIQTYMLY